MFKRGTSAEITICLCEGHLKISQYVFGGTSAEITICLWEGHLQISQYVYGRDICRDHNMFTGGTFAEITICLC